MKTIDVQASRPYPVLVGRGLLASLGERVARLDPPPDRAFLVADDTVRALHGPAALRALEAAGIAVSEWTFPHGEASKNWQTLGDLLQAMCDARLSRRDLVVALGGGVVGDLAGFAAAVYRRGIRFVQVPTTLLAAVDSSVGGKTAVDLPGGKNQAGAFHQPEFVLCDTATLDTLPDAEWACGAGEVAKYAVLFSAPFFRTLEERPLRGQIEDAIATCVQMKADIVARDEFESGERMLLNLGHTFGHAAELCSNYALPHGQAVAMGLAAIARAAAKRGICPANLPPRIEALLRKLGLPTKLPYPSADLAAAALSDKKASAATLPLVVPRAIGDCILLPVPLSDLSSWLA